MEATNEIRELIEKAAKYRMNVVLNLAGTILSTDVGVNMTSKAIVDKAVEIADLIVVNFGNFADGIIDEIEQAGTQNKTE